MLIILIGLPKAGTTSFDHLFRQLGFRSYHWVYHHQFIGTLMHQAKMSHRPLLSFLTTKTTVPVCLTQMDVCMSANNHFWPQITDFRQLWTENPQAIYILNTRDPDKMLSSWKRWNHLDQRMAQYNPELLVGLSGTLDQQLLALYQRHQQTIRQFFHEKQTPLIEFDIEHDSLEKLRPYIPIPQHITQLPHENKGTKSPQTLPTSQKTQSSDICSRMCHDPFEQMLCFSSLNMI